MYYELDKDENGNLYLKVSLTDFALISNPLLNKGSAFNKREREEFGLLGLIPPHEGTLDTQRERSYQAFKDRPTDIAKYIYLRDLQDSNEILFYNLICNYIEEMLPIVYTPTVGFGCQRFSQIYRRPRGIFIAYPYRNQIDQILAKTRFNKVKIIVVSDGERILGLGDQGAGGMGIPIGKLALYSACAGVFPDTTLPVLLDTGTNNPDLQKDPLYMGWRHERIRGQEYDDFVDAFVTAVKKRFPHVLLHWEDFAQINANPILERYRDQLCTFNDDIQGTAAVAAGTLLAAVNVTGTPLREQRVVIVGAGSAGCGIGNLIMKEMINDGLPTGQAQKRIFMVDRFGLLLQDTPSLLPFQKPFAQAKNDIAGWKLDDSNFISLKDVVKNIHPTLLIGVSGQPGIFTEEIVREMALHVERPVIFPLSNPTPRAEATPADLMRWTNDKAIISTGSPFEDIVKNGKPFRIDQTNNCYIFPGLGLGLIAVKAKRVTEEMFIAAAKALAETSPSKNNPNANLLAPLSDIRKVSYQVAIATAKEAISSGLAGFIPSEDLEKYLSHYMWKPEYLPYRRIK